MEAINQTYFQGLADLKNTNASRLTKYRTYKELSDKRDRQMKEVLRPEQFTVYQQQQKERKEEVKRNRRSR